MDPNKLSIQNIVNGVLDRHIPLADNMSQLLNPDPKNATDSIVRVLKQALNSLSVYLPMCRLTEIDVTDNRYYFTDNYEQYAKGEIELSEMSLIPDAIAKVGVGDRPLTANFWHYESPLLYCPQGQYSVRALYKYPIYLEYDSNGLLTANSHVFGISKDIEYQFNNVIDLAFLKTIKARTKLVNLPTSIDFLNFDDTIQELKEAIEDDKISASYAGYAWK